MFQSLKEFLLELLFQRQVKKGFRPDYMRPIDEPQPDTKNHQQDSTDDKKE
jgi:hypothetical protein